MIRHFWSFLSFFKGEVGTIISTNSSELKISETPSLTSDIKVEKEFTVRLGLVSIGKLGYLS